MSAKFIRVFEGTDECELFIQKTAIFKFALGQPFI
jgi:hypothetical protein